MSTDVQQILKSVQGLSLEDRQELLTALEEATVLPRAEPNRDLIQSIQGKYAHVRTSSDEFIIRKHEDLALEHFIC